MYVLIDVINQGWAIRSCKVEKEGRTVQITVEDHPGGALNDYRSRAFGVPGNMMVNPCDLFHTREEAEAERDHRQRGDEA